MWSSSVDSAEVVVIENSVSGDVLIDAVRNVSVGVELSRSAGSDLSSGFGCLIVSKLS